MFRGILSATVLTVSTAAMIAAERAEPAPKKVADWPRPRSQERADERAAMVQKQVANRDVRDENVLDAMRNVPRHWFVPSGGQRRAYADHPLQIGHGQTISQPYIVALMTELLDLKKGDKVLEIGTGSGYQAAVLNELTPDVYTIEIVKPLAKEVQDRFKLRGYTEIKSKQGDGYYGWKEHGPFDGIIVTCAAGHLPPPLWEQLKPGGRIVIPIGGVFTNQRLVLISKTADGKRRSKTVLAVRFVPMTGKIRER
jgi:protein-L-isoaspartate(D-aspartate) O-methyltransferase